MAMNPSSAASAIADKLKNHMSKYSEIEETGNTFKSKHQYVNYGFLPVLAKVLDDEFQKATTSKKNFLINAPAGTLTIPPGQGEILALNIATAVMTYWSLAITPGIQQYQEIKVIAVINDAATHIKPLYNDILSIRTTSACPPSFFKLCDTIIKHVKNITWMVTELGLFGKTGVYPENVT